MLRTLDEVRKLTAAGNVIPIYKEFPADLDTPITALLKLKRQGQGVFLLESIEVGEKLARFSFLGRNPRTVFQSKDENIFISGEGEKSYVGKPLVELQEFMNRFRGVQDAALPAFSGGAVGFVCYDAVRLVEKIPATGKDDYQLPDLHFGFYPAFIVFDHLQHKLRIVANVLVDEYASLEAAYTVALAQIEALEAEINEPLLLPKKENKTIPSPVWASNYTAEGYLKGVQDCKEYIKAGDAFQIVLAQRFTCKPEVTALQIYRALRGINPSPYMYYLDYGDFEIVGASPETLVKVQDGLAETKPIAGTRRRGKNAAEDLALEKELLADAKERAEHLMLVDLGRNDIGRVSEYGSVEVTQFMDVERHSHVMHIESVVRGKLKPEYTALQALMSCFPAGTLSGAPKIRAMEIIDSLEPTRRGLYGGAICYMDFRGNLDSCIAIRTLMLKDGVAYVQAGAGIVADSDPQAEFEETGHKAQAVMNAVAEARKI